MVKAVNHQHGLSLIELLIAILIAGILVLAAMPFTGSWVHANHVTESKNTLTQAWGHAKAMALRNPKKVQRNSPAAELHIADDGKIYACVHTCATALVTEKWTITPRNGVVVKFISPAGSSVFLSNLGHPMHYSGGAYDYVNQVKYEISKESEIDEGILY